MRVQDDTGREAPTAEKARIFGAFSQKSAGRRSRQSSFIIKIGPLKLLHFWHFFWPDVQIDGQ
jgi:hypothetical protein